MKVKEESEKVSLKLNIQRTKIMASGPITSWEIGGETVETVSDFIFGGSKITADGDCSHEIKRCLLLGRKVMTNLDIILKSRDITLPTKLHLVKALVLPVVMYGCERWNKESWVPKNWCFWTVMLEKNLESPLNSKRPNQSLLKEINPEYSLEGLKLKLYLPILWPPDAKNWLIEKDPDAGKDWEQEEKGMTEDDRLDGITDSVDMNLS